MDILLQTLDSLTLFFCMFLCDRLKGNARTLGRSILDVQAGVAAGEEFLLGGLCGLGERLLFQAVHDARDAVLDQSYV